MNRGAALDTVTCEGVSRTWRRREDLMFVQVITAPVGDAAAIERALDGWEKERLPQAKGFIGATSGISEQGHFVAIARFESEELARQNSDDPAQTAWWNELSKGFAGDATFHDCTEVDTSFGGGRDDAGFVQVIQGRATDKKALKEMSSAFEERMSKERPDVIGGITAWDGDFYTDVVYFTSESEARAGEAKAMPDDLKQEFERWQSLAGEQTFYDLKNPRLISR